MFKGKKIIAIIPAAGSGKRMKGETKKQYIKLKNKPILAHTISKYEENRYIDEIILVVPEGELEQCRAEIVELYQFQKIGKIVVGGKERQDSIWNALKSLEDEPDQVIVLIHDGVRPFLKDRLINEIIEEMDLEKAVILGVPVKDTIKRIDKNYVSCSIERDNTYAIQTPQAFVYELIYSAYKEAVMKGFLATDDAGILSQVYPQMPIKVIEGDYDNIKITTKEDLKIGEKILEEKTVKYGGIRVGSGYDVHQLVADRDLILGGVKIPCKKGLLGHSDADVLLHAIMDALLGAMALGDIGKHFSDQDHTYKNISSILLLKKVFELVKANHYEIQNIDSTIIAEKPKLAKYIEAMRKNIADALNIEYDAVGVKATTTEGLGFEGEQRGIAAQAIVSICKI